ncbi:MBOAT family O-acyltransferase [Flavobacterium branchiophilum]|uniref:Membrane-bound O-acyltransferase family protein n=1 Tax=Flavobacterium branchiophilum TaxID=55197 RepID=A0A2H3KEB7_9FLAO|nr:MBOAT family O-acyltransferase [Flavobacterium branchiophilum]PDS26540.1 membrane-bound O-acyltransferase family protein [Flavobacterium branchiophilum]
MTFSDINNWMIKNIGTITPETINNWVTYNPKSPILFNTPLFLGMFLIFYPLYIVAIKPKTHFYRNLYVFLFSLFFYYKSSGIYFALLLVSGVVDYNIAKLLYEEVLEGYRKFYLILSIVLNLCFLGYFKYTNFIIQNLNEVSGQQFMMQNIILPVGISFYTFQSMSYIIDIYRKELKPTKNILDYMFFVSFFPQLVAGPIVRASEFIPQIYSKLHLSRNDVNRALFLIIGGLIKKTFISDYIALNFVDRVFDAPKSYTAFENLMAAYGYTIQIYCDFSGYSDMAIGIALLMGFQLSTNFKTPYQSTSLTEFWRRWHISLSTWLRDYLYISIGGNRQGSVGGFLFPTLFFVGCIAFGYYYYPINALPLWTALAALLLFLSTVILAKDKKKTLYTNVNLLTTMLLGGLWHGPSFRFILWGALHGIGLAVHKIFSEIFPSSNTKKLTFFKIMGSSISLLLTFHFVAFCWIFFRAKDFSLAFDILQNISNLTFNIQQWQTIIMGYQNVFLVLFLGYVWHFLPTKITNANQWVFNKMPIVLKALVLALAFWVVYATSSSGPQPFIYFQF